MPTAMPSIISVSDSDLHEQSVPGTVLHPAPTGHRSRTRPVALRLNSTTTVAESDDLTDEFIADTNLSPGFTPTLSPGLSPLHAMPKRSAMRTASVSAETESPSPLPVSKSVAWGSDVEEQPETPKPRISRRDSVRDSFSRFARRLTYGTWLLPLLVLVLVLHLVLRLALVWPLASCCALRCGEAARSVP